MENLLAKSIMENVIYAEKANPIHELGDHHTTQKKTKIHFLNWLKNLTIEQENKKMMNESKKIQTEKAKISKRIEDLRYDIDELDFKREALLEQLEFTSFKPKRRKIHHKLSEICWKLDKLQEKERNLEIELDEELYY